jgi:hypothetical protein
MSDICCRKCGEPYDSYGITYSIGDGDMTTEEARKFRAGQGCPSCEFGAICTECRGTGKARSSAILMADCKTCFGQRYVILRRLLRGGESWDIGYIPNMRKIQQPVTILKKYPVMQKTRDGWTEEAKALCPDCADKVGACQTCNGSGKLTREPSGGLKI